MEKKQPGRDKYLQRWNALKSERSDWLAHWQQLSTYILPYNGRFLSSDRNKGNRRFNQILDSTGTRSAVTLAAGMMAGMTSPARPWFRLATPDPALMEYHPVKQWLHDTTRVMLDTFQRSNTYNTLHHMYQELGVFGTATSFTLPDFDKVIRNYPLTVGEYALAADFRGEINAMYREFDITVGQMVKEFGYDKCSQRVRNLFDNHSLDKWFTIIHVVEQNHERDLSLRDNYNMPWRSVYFEKGNEQEKYLSESGFERFPVLAPRWQTLGGDVYGISPGMTALGDIKQLQHEQLRKAEGIDYKTRPPLQVPTSLKNQDTDMLPGGITYVDSANPSGAIRSLWEVNIDQSALLEDIRDVRERIRSSFFADMFLMLANNDLGRMTATEVAERHEEKLLMLGPVLERLHNELLDPLVEMTFHRLLSAGMLPPPPEELEGVDLQIEFVSMLAQAQRAIGVNSSDRYVMTLGQIASLKPDVLDKFDADKWADLYADQLGVDPSVVVPSEQVALIRQERAQQQQAQQAAAMANEAATTAKTMSETDTQGSNGLTDMMNLFSGYTMPQ